MSEIEPIEQERAEEARPVVHSLARVPVTEAARSRFTPEQIVAIRRTVAPNLNDEQCALFLEIAARYQLDPFRGEIWPVIVAGKFVPLVGRDGLLNIAERFADYRGFRCDVVRERDSFHRTTNVVAPHWGVFHEYDLAGATEDQQAKARGKCVGAYALVFREGREPTWFFAPWEEYNKGQNAWKTHPTAMIGKAALANALRLAFNLSGLYVAEEFGATDGDRRPVTAVDDSAPDYGDDELGTRLRELVDEANALRPGSYRPAKVRALLGHSTDQERRGFLESLEGAVAALRAEARDDAQKVLEGQVVN